MTFLEAINKVLIRLREPKVTSSADSELIAEFVNESLREVENAWRWVALRDTIEATTVSGDYRYRLTGVKERFTLRGVYNRTTKRELQMRSPRWLDERFNREALEGEPFYFDISGVDDQTGDYFLDMYPIPNDEWVININIVKGQADILEDDDEILVPSYPVMLGAYYKAIVERGEDGGMMAAEAYQNYSRALGDEVAMDVNRSADGSSDWHSHQRYISRHGNF